MTQARMLGGRYELGELIGYGGMAEVHLARDTRLNRDVAIKVLRADLARDQSFLTRFRREAHSSAGLNHPSIVSVYDTGEDLTPDGTPAPYIVMEFVDGRTLRDILKSEGRIPARRAMEITADICAALEFSHRNGIIHRDIKPANVMITPAGAVKVMDFGIARAVADTSATVTQTANVIGTAQYLSPEQARGEAVDARSDVYSTGCLLYELVTGVPPFQGDSPVAVAYQHVRENPVMPSARNPEIPREIDSIVMKALAKNQLNRYQSAGDMRSDIQRALANQPVQAEAVMTDAERTQFIARTPPTPVAGLRRGYAEPPEDPSRRRTALIWVAIVVALLVVIGVGSWAIFGLGSQDNGPKKIVVPMVVGQTQQAAEQSLTKAGFKPVLGAATSGTCQDGESVSVNRVCTLSTPGGRKLVKGSTVTFHLYAIPTEQVPSVVGKQYSDAVDALTALHLKAVRKEVNSSMPQGQVVNQNPPVYTKVAEGAAVTLDVSNGKVELPDVTGKQYDKAVRALNEKGFTNIKQGDVVITRDQSKDGEVANEDPTAGIAYPLDTPITLAKYVYQKPQPSCTSTTPRPPGPPQASTPGSSSSSSTSTLPPCPGSSTSGSSSGSFSPHASPDPHPSP